MQNQENMNDRASINNSGVMNSPLNMQSMNQFPIYQPQVNPMAGTMAYQMVYPEIFYKLQPYIMMVCDQMDTFGPMMPTQVMVEQMTDSIYDDVCKMYPDLAKYAGSKENDESAVETARFGRGPDMFGGRFRRRGLLRDLIDILFISEFFRRRRRY